MTSLLDGLELKPFYGYCRKDKILSGNANANSFVFDEDYETLKKVLEAALAVIDADGAAEYKLAVLNAQDGINKDWRGDAKLQTAATAAFRELEECLKPFKKEGLG